MENLSLDETLSLAHFVTNPHYHNTQTDTICISGVIPSGFSVHITHTPRKPGLYSDRYDISMVSLAGYDYGKVVAFYESKDSSSPLAAAFNDLNKRIKNNPTKDVSIH